MKALAPGFLIAMPQLQDRNFHQAVILMVEHNDEGSMGLVINRTSDLTFGELARSQELTVANVRHADPVFVGGPVEPARGFVLHNSTLVRERNELLPGLFLSVTTDALEPLLVDESVTLRFCLGYAGWGPGQLERELREGSWLFCEASRDAVLVTEPGKVWETVIFGMGINPGMLVTTGGLN
jgi:putative transcriptional regulator